MDRRLLAALPAYAEQAAARRDSDNGGDALQLAWEHLVMSKEGSHCCHGVDYLFGGKEGERPVGETLIGGPRWTSFCRCCARPMRSSGHAGADGFATGTISERTLCETCRGE